MTRNATGSYAEQLFFDAALRAERTVAVLRVSAALFVGISFAVFAGVPAKTVGFPIASIAWLVTGFVSAYFLLGLLGLWAARPRIFRRWMSWAFATGDVVLYVGAVGIDLSVHDTPVNYAAAFPSVWMGPVVLAFGALRYNPRLLMFVAGLMVVGLAVVGLLTGGWVDAMQTAQPDVLARRYSAPPNLMRLVMLTVAAAVLAIAVYRSRTVLLRAIDETRRKINLTRYLPQGVADRVADSGVDELLHSRRQAVAVLFADIRNFTARTETMAPEELERFLTEFRRRVSAAVEGCGGTVDKFMGDGVMAVFGVPKPSGGDARKAVDCGVNVLRAVSVWNESLTRSGQDPVTVGVGIHWGDAFCGAIGDETRLEYTVLGDVVNVAARVEEQTKALGRPLLVTADVLTAAEIDPRSSGHWRRLPERTVRGRQAPVALYAYVSEPA